MKIISQYKGLRKEVYVLFFGRIVTNMGSMVWPLMTLILNRKLGMNATEVALFTIITGTIYIPATIIGGKLADKYNRKMVIVWCDLVSILFYYIAALLPLSLFSIVLLTIAGSVQELEHPAYTALIADITETKDREKAYSLTYLGLNLGIVFAPIIAGFLFEDYLWLAFVLSGTAIGISTLLIYLLINDITPVEEDGDQRSYQENREGESLWTILKENRILFLYAAIITLYSGAYSQYGYLLPMDMAAIHGDKGAVIYGSVSSINGLTVVLFTPILTRVLRNLASTRKCTLGHILVIVGYASFLLFRGFVPFYYLAMFLFTLGEILATFVEGPYLTQRVPNSHRGRVTGIMSLSKNILGGVTRLLAGILYDKGGAPLSWSLILGMLGFSLLLCLFFILWDKRRYPALYAK